MSFSQCKPLSLSLSLKASTTMSSRAHLGVHPDLRIGLRDAVALHEPLPGGVVGQKHGPELVHRLLGPGLQDHGSLHEEHLGASCCSQVLLLLVHQLAHRRPHAARQVRHALGVLEHYGAQGAPVDGAVCSQKKPTVPGAAQSKLSRPECSMTPTQGFNF